MSRKNKHHKRDKNHKDIMRETEDDKGWGALHSSRIEDFKRRLDVHQMNYYEALGNFPIVGVDAKSGSGKTTIAVARALEMLKNGQVDAINYVRFPDARGQKLGSLPGTEDEKKSGYMFPFYEAAANFGLRTEDVDKLIAQEVIELNTDMFYRGRTKDNTFLIIDEAQNGNMSDIRLMLTRVTDFSYTSVIGHSGQLDSKMKRYGPNNWLPFQVYLYHMDKKSFTKVCELQHDYRGKVSRWADKIDETIKELEQIPEQKLKLKNA